MGPEISSNTNKGNAGNKTEKYFTYHEAESYEVSCDPKQSRPLKGNEEIMDEETLKVDFLLNGIARGR